MKLKVKPSAKIKRRYLLIDGKKADVEKTILDYIGILGWAGASPVFVDTFKKTKHLVLSIDRSSLVQVRAAFTASNTKAKILKVSGTLKSLTK